MSALFANRNGARARARKALEFAWDGNLPANPSIIAKRLIVYRTDPETDNRRSIKIEVRPRPGAEIDKVSCQALLVADDAQTPSYLIEYNQDEISYRNRFAIAHALGHVVLGHVNAEQPTWRDADFPDNTQFAEEIEANAFAIELVLPEREFRTFLPVAKSIQQLAECFGVSTAAIRYRAKQLRLLNL